MCISFPAETATLIRAAQINLADAFTFTGNVTATAGQNTFSTYNVDNIVFVDGIKYACTDVGLNAAVSSLNVSTGARTVDARGCPTMTIAGTVTVGANTGVNSEGIQLLLPCTGSINITATGGVHVFQMADEGELVGCGKTATHITLANTANIADVISFLGNPANNNITERARVRGIAIQSNASATVVNGIMNLQNSYDGTFQDTTLAGAAPCLLFVADTSAAIAPNANDFENLLVDGQYTAGTIPICITAKNGGNVGPIHFRGGDWGHPGSTKPLLQINRSGGGTTHSFGISISDLYVESNNTDTTTAVFSVADTVGFSLNNVFINRLSGSSIAACVSFADTTGQTSNINIRNLTCTGGSNTNAVTSSVSGLPSKAVTVLPLYDYGVTGTGGYGVGNDGFTIGSGAAITSSGAGGTMTATIASSTAIMTTGAISSLTCGTTVTVAASGVASTDSITWSFNAAPAANPGELVVSAWPTTNNVNFQYCNPTAGSVTPNAATLNWRVTR